MKRPWRLLSVADVSLDRDGRTRHGNVVRGSGRQDGECPASCCLVSCVNEPAPHGVVFSGFEACEGAHLSGFEQVRLCPYDRGVRAVVSCVSLDVGGELCEARVCDDAQELVRGFCFEGAGHGRPRSRVFHPRQRSRQSARPASLRTGPSPRGRSQSCWFC